MLFSAAVTAPSTRHRLASKVPIISSSFSVSRLVKQRTLVDALAVELVVNASSCPCCALNTSRSSIFLPFHFCVSCRNQCGNRPIVLGDLQFLVLLLISWKKPAGMGRSLA